jgi:hypothetical protein
MNRLLKQCATAFLTVAFVCNSNATPAFMQRFAAGMQAAWTRLSRPLCTTAKVVGGTTALFVGIERDKFPIVPAMLWRGKAYRELVKQALGNTLSTWGSIYEDYFVSSSNVFIDPYTEKGHDVGHRIATKLSIKKLKNCCIEAQRFVERLPIDKKAHEALFQDYSRFKAMLKYSSTEALRWEQQRLGYSSREILLTLHGGQERYFGMDLDKLFMAGEKEAENLSKSLAGYEAAKLELLKIRINELAASR